MGKRLVRDRALENWVVPGAEHQVRPVTGRAEHQALLRAKLLEECGEVMMAEDDEELLKEIGDVLSVLQALAWTNGLSWHKDVLAHQEARDAASGGFVNGLVWETSR
jgi:predicted house-cleaning noncanonical NTP pyrophosphatase (MazG superfamily)